MARPCTKLKRPKNSEWFKEKMLLAQALEAEVVSDEEQMAFLVDNRERIATGQDTQELTTTAIFETNDLDAFDSDCDEAPSASAVLMAKLSTYDSDVLSETENEVVQDTTSSTQQDAMIMSVIEEMSNQVAKCNEVNKLNKTHDALSILNTEDTLKLAEESKLKMNAKQNDPIAKEKKVNIAPIDYDALNKLLDHFVKHFVPKKQLSAEQAFWLPISQTVSEKPTRGNIFEIEKKELFIENDRLLEYIICQDLMYIAMHADLDSKCGVPAHDDNLTYAEMEKNILLMNTVEQAIAQQPLDSALDYACKFTTRIQELLVYVSATCPSSLKKNEKLVAVIPMNKSRKVRFVEPSTSISGVKSSTSASGSKPLGNRKKNRISRTSSSNQKNKVRSP
ncbi:hypothetical protein Tco_0765991 [Tanacetum coccineum]